jgi:DNA-binding MarR family transcriptional regulator
MPLHAFNPGTDFPMTNVPKKDNKWFSGRVNSVLFYKVALLNSSFSKIVAQEAASGGLTLLQFKVLSAIGSFAPLPAAKISESLTIDQAAISRTVRQLLDLKLITRRLSAQDGRVIELTLSRQGSKKYGEIAHRLDEYQDKLLQGFDAQQRAWLLTTLDTLLTQEPV